MASGFQSKDFRFEICLGAVVLIVGTLFALFVIREWNGPMFGGGDMALWGDSAWYVGQNVRLLPFPRFDLANDQAFYPYGANHVFSPWGLERDLLVGGLTRHFGQGPWIQAYFLLSLIVIVWGSYLLLVREHGKWSAVCFAVILAFGNYYSIGKYPGHTSYASVHWTTLNLVVDYLLLRRFLRKEMFSARLLLVKVVLLILALGEDLGYVAGYAYTAFTLTLIFIAMVDTWRNRWHWPWGPRRLKTWWRVLRDSATEHKRQIIFLSGIGAAAAFVYLPLAVQIVLAARSFNLNEIPQGALFSSPLRMLVPILPGVRPAWLNSWFHDKPYGLFSNAPGWFFVIGGILGMAVSRKSRLMALPWLILMVMCLAHHNRSFPVLQIFPWSSFARINSRASVIYPVILGLLSIPFYEWAAKTSRRKPFLALMAAVFVMEASTAYSLIIRKRAPCFIPDAAFYSLMEKVRQSPGEAVLDWPFCVAAGNGITSRLGMMSFYELQAGIGALRQFHGKKVVGYYYGRLHPSQLRPFLDRGWNRMFFPDKPSIHEAQSQTRDFNPREWAFFEQFFKLNDFCGILLYPELLPRETVLEMHNRFGEPLARATVPRAGTVEFIPKPAHWHKLVDKEKGRILSLNSIQQLGSKP